ncbi:MAG: ATP-binding protein [Candidatus Baltobacteraceae bacterium]|jgi:DNA helicase HerA-like ATPase
MIGYVDGSVEASTRRFNVVLQDGAVVQLDDLVVTRQQLGDGREVAHYGIVVEAFGAIEGALMPSDTHRIGENVMPGLVSRSVTVQMLRSVPELWLPPLPGSPVEFAAGAARDEALFVDQMAQRLAVGLDQHDRPIYADFRFMNGERGGHVSISGVSGVATKTSYALFLLYQLLETPQGAALLGPARPQTHALVFNVKGEDLLHLDRRNSAYDAEREDARWHALGVERPGPFSDVEFFVPRASSASDGSRAVDITSRPQSEVTVFGWTPEQFVKRQLLRFCFGDEARTQVPFVEEHVRLQLARHAYPSTKGDGSIVLVPQSASSSNIDRVLTERRPPKEPGEGEVIANYGDLVSFLRDRLTADPPDPVWSSRFTEGTIGAFLRRIFALQPRLGRLISTRVAPVELRRSLSVVDLHLLHDDAQRFVVGALLSEIFDAKQGTGREPLRFIVLDELNKYAPREGTSPIKEVLIDIAARGRSLGVLLIGAQQNLANVDRAISINAALKVVGRLDAGTADEYKFLTSELRERAARFLPGTMVLDQPLVPAPIPLRFPFPPYATNTSERPGASESEAAAAVFERL